VASVECITKRVDYFSNRQGGWAYLRRVLFLVFIAAKVLGQKF
jgi:hypothetical protein